MSDKAARLAETVNEALHFALSRTTDDPVQYRRIAAALAAVDELTRVSREAEQRPESREGMVTVYDHDGKYVGCMGSETWQEAEQHESLKMTVRHVAGSLEGGNTDTDTLAATLRAALAAADNDKGLGTPQESSTTP